MEWQTQGPLSLGLKDHSVPSSLGPAWSRWPEWERGQERGPGTGPLGSWVVRSGVVGSMIPGLLWSPHPVFCERGPLSICPLQPMPVLLPGIPCPIIIAWAIGKLYYENEQ